jgi:hypothetical protein
MSEPLNLPAEIDLIHRQLDQARDIETVLEIHDRAEALREYCKRRDDLLEAGNRLAGITALCERRIGQELRRMPRNTGAMGIGTSAVGDTDSTPPTLEELGFKGSAGRERAAAYKELADNDVTEQVLLDAIALAGKEGRSISKADIQRARHRRR